MNEKPTLRDWLWIKPELDYSKRKWLGGFIAFLLGLLMIAGLIIAGALILRLLGTMVGYPILGQTDTDAAIRNLGLAVVAIFSAPFLAWRTMIAQNQANTAEQGHITDRINTAVQGLGAEKTVKRDGEESTEPNLEVRIGAIYALERIAQDSDRDHIQIMEILCAYIRNNAPVANAAKSPHEVFDRLYADGDGVEGLHPEEIFENSEYIKANRFYGFNPTDLTPSNLERWARGLQTPRVDIATALKIIGRRSQKLYRVEIEAGFTINLENTNLQRSHLEGNFMNTNFANSALDGANLVGNFSKSDFSNTSLQVIGANNVDAHLSNFTRTNLNSAQMGYSNYNGARFWFSQMNKTGFNGAKMIGTDWYGASHIDVFFYFDADVSHSRFMKTNISKINGLLEGQSNSLWIEAGVEMTKEQEARHPKKSVLENELGFRRLWHKELIKNDIKYFQ